MQGFKGRQGYLKNKWIVAGSILLGIMVLLAVFVPLVSEWSYTEQNAAARNLLPSAEHWFGTDKFGRDIFVRVWYGTRISLEVGIMSAFLNGMIGICYGGIAGYTGGKTDLLFMRLVDILDAIPSLLYLILIMLVLEPGIKSVVFSICVSGWTDTARIVRGEILRLKKQEFCLAAKLAGARPFHILFRHLLPNASGAIIVNLTFLIPKAIFTESFLSFIGVGIAAPAASLGTLIREAESQMQIYSYQMLCPMLALCALVLAIHLIGFGMEQEGA